jgi:hypothetical protein
MLPETFTFTPLKKRQIQADFSGGHITSDAGLLLLREIDRKSRLTERVANCLADFRQTGKVKHELVDMIRQRVYGIACGYEDLNDHDSLRADLAFQTALNRLNPLASKATLGRMEQGIDRQTVVSAHQVMWQRFIDSYDQPPKRIVLDFDGAAQVRLILNYMAISKGSSSTGTTTITATCRSMFFVAGSYWSAICARAISMGQSTVGPSPACW